MVYVNEDAQATNGIVKSTENQASTQSLSADRVAVHPKPV